MTRRDMNRRDRASLLRFTAILAIISKTVGTLLGYFPRSTPHLYFLAVLSGILMGLTSAPTNGWPLAWIAQTPLWFIIYHQSIQNPKPKIQNLSFPGHSQKKICEICEICGPAFLWGFGYYGTTLIWITGLHPLTWMGIPWAASLAIALTCWLIITLWGCIWSMTWALGFTWLNRRFLPQLNFSHGLSRVLVGTALWCGLDTLWSQGILYWPTLAFTQSPHNLWVLQLNQLSGPITTTAIIAAVNGLMAEAWITYHRSSAPPFSPTPDSPRSAETFDERSIELSQLQSVSARPYLLTAIALGAIAHILGAWLYIQRSPAPMGYAVSEPSMDYAVSDPSMGYAVANPSYGAASPASLSSLASTAPLTIGLIQGNIPTSVKLTGDGIRQAFNRYTESYLTLAEAGVDMVLMPEGALPVLWQEPAPNSNPVVRAIRTQQVPAIIGTFVPQKSAQESAVNTITQSLLMTTTDRDSSLTKEGLRRVNVISQYNKVKLVPLGEYIPAAGILGAIINRLSPIQSSMVPGPVGQRFETPFGPAIAGICYESAFPDLFRRQAALGGEFIITASNNDPYNGAMMAQHHAQDVMRAIESDRWAVRVTNTGYSGVVNHRGQTMWRSQRNIYETHMARIYRRHTQTPYVRWGNWLTPVLGSLAIIVLGIAPQQSRRQV